MKKTLSTLTTVAVVASGAILLQGPATSAAAAAKANPERTPFAFSGSGFGTRVNGGDVPAGSDTTAYQALGCTNVAGRSSENHVTAATVPGAGTASEVTTDVWTTKSGDVVASHARNSIERVVLGDESTGTLEINAVSTVVRAFHDGDGFAAESRSRIGSLLYTDPAGMQQELEIPAPGEPVAIPGLGELTVGRKIEKANGSHAVAAGDALVLRRAVTGTKIKIAHAAAEVADDVKHGLFNGRSAAVQSRALQDNVTVGAQPLSLMPCQGTEGQLLTKAIARLDIGDNVVVRGLTSRLIGDQTRALADGYTRGRVQSVEIGGRVTAENVIGRANVVRTDGSLKRNTDGSGVGEVMVDGEEQEFPPSDVIEVPGLVRLERNIVRRIENGIAITALRITLLDGSGAVIDLGEARMLIRDAYL